MFIVNIQQLYPCSWPCSLLPSWNLCLLHGPMHATPVATGCDAIRIRPTRVLLHTLKFIISECLVFIQNRLIPSLS